jgi:hypothetical protein
VKTKGPKAPKAPKTPHVPARIAFTDLPTTPVAVDGPTCAICGEKPVDTTDVSAIHLQLCRGCVKTRRKHVYSYRLYPLGSASLGQAALDWITTHVPAGSTVVELGSGPETGWLAKRFQVISIEDDARRIDKEKSTYVHAPLVDYAPGKSWYDVEAVRKGLEGRTYSLLIVDGPGWQSRANLIDHLDLFDLRVPILMDDVNAPGVAELFDDVCEHAGRTGTRIFCGGHHPTRAPGKWIGVIESATMQAVTDVAVSNPTAIITEVNQDPTTSNVYVEDLEQPQIVDDATLDVQPEVFIEPDVVEPVVVEPVTVSPETIACETIKPEAIEPVKPKKPKSRSKKRSRPA